MLQDIEPHKLNNEFKIKTPKNSDYLLVFNGDSLLMDNSKDSLNFTTVNQIKDIDVNLAENSIYLFTIDETSVFCAFSSVNEAGKFKYVKVFNLREILPEWMVYIASTANHLASWYSTNKFCGRCATKMEFSKTERALFCNKCGLIEYPKISPAIIVGVVNDDKILLTRYADRPYKKLSLVAGFVEFGETLETTIKREVMEEVGLKVKNIRYYKSQPWAFSQSVLVGFFAELDGCEKVKIDKSELSEANWYRRDEIPKCESVLSLTNEMIESFRLDKVSLLQKTF